MHNFHPRISRNKFHRIIMESVHESFPSSWPLSLWSSPKRRPAFHALLKCNDHTTSQHDVDRIHLIMLGNMKYEYLMLHIDWYQTMHHISVRGKQWPFAFIRFAWIYPPEVIHNTPHPTFVEWRCMSVYIIFYIYFQDTHFTDIWT